MKPMKLFLRMCHRRKYCDAEPSAFCDWLLANNNCEGESFLTLHYDREDPLISEQKLASEVFGKVRRLVPLYNLLTQRKK